MPFHAIGLMSGTSADGVDGVVLAIHDGDFSILATETVPYPDTLRQSVRELCDRRIRRNAEAGVVEDRLNSLYADVATRLKDKVAPVPIDIIGCHGQTVNHSPDSDPPFTLQLGNGATIARRTGIPVVSDFRSRDISAGGQGAPLAPAFHLAAFHSSCEHRAVINIGGISNITILPKGSDGKVIGFDIGPGNTLMDNWCSEHFSVPFDPQGSIAESGTVQDDLLDILLDEEYFGKEPPKSTGLEMFNPEWLDGKLRRWSGDGTYDNRDVLATLSALTASTIGQTVNDIHPDIDTAYICGGGACNSGLMDRIRRRCRAKVLDTGSAGIDPKWVEAAAFAWMAYQTAQGRPSTLPSVTGARYPCIAGTVSQPDK